MCGGRGAYIKKWQIRIHWKIQEIICNKTVQNYIHIIEENSIKYWDAHLNCTCLTHSWMLMAHWWLWTECPTIHLAPNTAAYNFYYCTWSFLIVCTCIRSTCQRESSVSDTICEVMWPYLSVQCSIVTDFSCLLLSCRWNRAGHHSWSRSTCPHKLGLRSPHLPHVHGSSYQADQASSFYMRTRTQIQCSPPPNVTVTYTATISSFSMRAWKFQWHGQHSG